MTGEPTRAARTRTGGDRRPARGPSGGTQAAVLIVLATAAPATAEERRHPPIAKG